MSLIKIIQGRNQDVGLFRVGAVDGLAVMSESRLGEGFGVTARFGTFGPGVAVGMEGYLLLAGPGTQCSFLGNLMANFSTEGWSGPASFHYQEKKKWLLDLKTEETDAIVRLWIHEYAEDLQRKIDH